MAEYTMKRFDEMEPILRGVPGGSYARRSSPRSAARSRVRVQ